MAWASSEQWLLIIVLLTEIERLGGYPLEDRRISRRVQVSLSRMREEQDVRGAARLGVINRG